MLVYCDNCGYKTGDYDTREELTKVISKAGGEYIPGNACPKCKESELVED